MHLLATRPGGYAAGDGVVDLGQTPADVVILSAADTDLLLLGRAQDHLEHDEQRGRGRYRRKKRGIASKAPVDGHGSAAQE